MNNKFLIAVAVLFGFFLTACGGGGGSSSTSSVDLGGTFGKGLYKYADVQAYEVIGGTLVPTGSKVTTDQYGAYSLQLKATSNPVVVEMTTTSATRMLDETNNFAEMTPKVGTKIRTMVAELTTSMPEVHGNLFTEMAVEGAKNAGGLTPASIAASKALIQSATGIDPFTIKPVGAPSATMDSSQEKLMTLMTAMMVEAKALAAGSGGRTACTGDSTGVSCLVNTLNTKAALTTSAGTFSVTDASGLNTYLTATTTALRSYSPVGADAGGFIAKMKSSSTVVEASMAPPNQLTISATDAANRQGLDSFLQAMRSGFNSAEKAIRDRTDAANLRVDQFVLEHVGDGIKVLGDAMKACTNTSGVLTCTTGGNSIFTASGAGYSFSYYVDASGAQIPSPVLNQMSSSTANAYQYQGTVAASSNSSAGTASASVVASKTLDSKKISDITISFSGVGIKENSLSGSVSLNDLTVKAYDQTVGSSKWAQISLNGSTLSATRPSVGGLGTLTLVAPLAFTTSDGDVVSGKINSLVAKEKVTNTLYDGSKSTFPISADLSLDVAVQEGALLGLRLVASQNIDAYNPDLPSSVDNPENRSVLASFKLADNVSVVLTGSKVSSTPNETNVSVKITSNGNWINVAGKTKRASSAVNESIDGGLQVTSSGVYTATLTKSNNGQIGGTISKAGQQIGVVENGIIKVAGIEVSLR